jgi:thioredoxin-related protein
MILKIETFSLLFIALFLQTSNGFDNKAVITEDDIHEQANIKVEFFIVLFSVNSCLICSYTAN